MKALLVSFSMFLAISVFGIGNWVQLTDFGGEARHRTTGLSIGNKIYFGLGHYNGAGVNILFGDWWEYDPGTGAWTQKADYGGGPCYHATGFSIENKGYVGTGRVSASGSTLVTDFYKYDAMLNQWTSIAPFIGSERRGAVSFVVNNKAYVGTGESNGGRTGSFFEYDPATDVWTQITSIPASDRTSSVAFAIDQYGYVGTGDISGGSTNDFWRYDPSTDTWEQKANVGLLTRQEATGFSIGGKGYIGTGDDMASGTNYKDFWEYDPALDSWTQIDDFIGTARRYFTSVVHNEVAYCGLGTNGTNFKDFWKFDPTLGIDDLENQVEVNIYPNPTIDFATVQANSSDKIEYEIYNSQGKIVCQGSFYNETTIYFGEFSKGTYILKGTAGKSNFNQKLIKK